MGGPATQPAYAMTRRFLSAHKKRAFDVPTSVGCEIVRGKSTINASFNIKDPRASAERQGCLATTHLKAMGVPLLKMSQEKSPYSGKACVRNDLRLAVGERIPGGVRRASG